MTVRAAVTGVSVAVLAVVVLAASSAAFAKDPPKSAGQTALDDAAALAKKGDAVKAAERYGDALAIAQAASDLELERAATDSLAKWYDALPAPARTGATSDGPARASVLAAVMGKLDADRCGASVSAPLLAREVLQEATETGDFGAVAAAAKVAAAHKAKASSGAAAAVVAKYAEGLAAAAGGKFDQATAPLEAAAAEAAKAGWLVLATHASTEAAAARMKLGAADKATAALSTTVAAIDLTTGFQLAVDWSSMLATRIPGAEAVHKPVMDLIGKLAPHPPGGSATPGAAGADAGVVPITPIGKLLPKLAKSKPIVSARRTAGGFEIRWATKATGPAAAPLKLTFQQSVQHAGDGGVWIDVHCRSVALRTVDLVGDQGGFEGRTDPSAVRAHYLLADGETWTVSKEGVVTISH